jgi:hypothetical protein
MDYCRRKGKHHQACLIGKHAVTMPQPSRALLLAPWVYEYGLLKQFSVASYHCGHHQDCVRAIGKLLEEGKIPEEARERLRNNAELAAERLAAPAARTESTAITGQQHGAFRGEEQHGTDPPAVVAEA